MLTEEPGDAKQVLDLLAQRGLEISCHSRPTYLYVPPAHTDEAARAFYSLMKRYSFRLFLRDVIRFRGELEPSKLTHFVDADTATTFLAALEELGMIERVPGEDRLLVTTPVENFGATLEWYVARVLKLEFAIPAVFGVRLRGTGSGGDYDVIGAMSGQLVYVETKSAPPKHIEDREVEVFLERLWEMRPDLAVFLVDTNLRMLDKVVQQFERCGVVAQRLHDEIFHVDHRIFVTNTKHDLSGNLRVCFKDYHGARFRWPGRPRSA